MSFRETIESALKNPNISLLGQIVLSDEEYEELLEVVRGRVINIQLSTTITPADIYIAVALVQIAIRKYKEGNYWEYFKEELGLEISSSKTNYIGQMFISTLNKHHLFQLERDPGTKYAYVENIKAHAIVPNNYMSGYWDFIYSFYDKNLLRQLPEDIDVEFIEMSDFFLSTLNEGSDSITLKSLDSKPGKSYKLLKATRALFAQGDPTTLSNIVYSHLKIIDDYYYEGVKDNSDNRFAIGFSEWIEKEGESLVGKDKKAKRKSGVFYRKPYFIIDRKNETAFLNIPEQKIRNEDYDGSVNAIIYTDGNKEVFKLSPYKAFGILVTDPIKIPIPDIFSEIKIIIKTKAERVFVINSQKYRIFDEDFFEIPKLRKGKNYILAQKETYVRGEKPDYVGDYAYSWNEYAYEDIDAKSAIYIDDIPISITGSFALGIDFAFESKDYSLFKDGARIQTCYKHPDISFKIPERAVAGSYLIINDHKYNVWDTASSILDIPDEKDVNGVTFMLEDLLPNKRGVYDVFLDEAGKNTKSLCSYVYLPDLRCRAEKYRYIFAKEAILSISGNYDIEPINCLEVTSSRYAFDLSEQKDNAEFILNIDDSLYTLSIPIKVFKYGFEGKLQTSKLDYIMLKDLKNDLHIYMPGAEEVSAYIANKGHHDIEIYGEKVGENYFRIDISHLVHIINESKSPFNYINIRYRDNKYRSLSLFRVLSRIYVEKAELVLDDEKRLAADISYLGKGDLILGFEDSDGNKIVERKVQNGLNYFPELTSSEKYTLILKQSESDKFGFGSEERILYTRYRAGAVDYSDISNCELMINDVKYDSAIKKLNYIYWISDIRKIDDYTYYGTLYERKKSDNRGLKFKKIALSQAVKIECIQEKDSLSIISIQTDYDDGVYDPLYYDTQLRKLVVSDKVSSKEYNRFLPLYDDRTDYYTAVRRK